MCLYHIKNYILFILRSTIDSLLNEKSHTN